MSGEEQLYLIEQDGAGKPEQLTTRFQAMLFAPAWAPDGARLALSDKNGRLYAVTVADRKVTEVARDEFGGDPRLHLVAGRCVGSPFPWVTATAFALSTSGAWRTGRCTG